MKIGCGVTPQAHGGDFQGRAPLCSVANQERIYPVLTVLDMPRVLRYHPHR